MKSRYSLFISACKGADSQGKFVYLHGRGEFSGARGAYNYCKRTGDKVGELAIYNCVVNRKGKKFINLWTGKFPVHFIIYHLQSPNLRQTHH